MNFTFGIITGGGNEKVINMIIDSIEALDIPEYEILIVGNSYIQRKRTKVFLFDENFKQKWITRKKNIITREAKCENIVYLHDYVIFDREWYKGFLKFGKDFKACMTPIVQPDGSRFRDWTLWAEDSEKLGLARHHCLLPYNMTHLSKYMYFSGTYWVAKKDVMIEFPLNECLAWGEGEDVLWSKQVRSKYDFSINPYSYVGLLKPKDVVFRPVSPEEINRLQSIK